MTSPLTAVGEERLRECPFCGASNAMMFEPTCRRETPYNAADRLFPIVRCMSCYCEVAGANEDYRGGSAIAAWNRRSPVPEGDGLRVKAEAEVVAVRWQREMTKRQENRDLPDFSPPASAFSDYRMGGGGTLASTQKCIRQDCDCFDSWSCSRPAIATPSSGGRREALTEALQPDTAKALVREVIAGFSWPYTFVAQNAVVEEERANKRARSVAYGVIDRLRALANTNPTGAE